MHLQPGRKQTLPCPLTRVAAALGPWRPTKGCKTGALLRHHGQPMRGLSFSSVRRALPRPQGIIKVIGSALLSAARTQNYGNGPYLHAARRSWPERTRVG